jgi:hypothetical protein
MSVIEKIEMTHWSSTEPFDCLPEPACIDHHPEEANRAPRYKEVRPFLLNGPAYQWLLENAQSSAVLTGRKGTILATLTRKIESTLQSIISPKSRQPQILQARFDIDWDLPNFLKGQEYDTTLEFAFERAITITGSKDNAQAMTCMDYMCQTWPSSGREVVQALKNALISPNLSCSGKQSFRFFIQYLTFKYLTFRLSC